MPNYIVTRKVMLPEVMNRGPAWEYGTVSTKCIMQMLKYCNTMYNDELKNYFKCIIEYMMQYNIYKLE